MGAISYLYNLSPSSLTLSNEEKEKLGIADAKKSTLNPDLSKVTSQVSGFFSNLFKEVKSMSSQAADDIVANLSQSTPTSSVQPSAPAVAYRQNADQLQQEEYELQLAMALSLSQTQEQKELELSPSMSPETKEAVLKALNTHLLD